MNFVLAFGIGSISVMFLGFASGFAIGKFWLGYDDDRSLVLSLVMGIGTLILEAFLMIFRLDKWEKKRQFDKKRYKLE